MIAVRRLRKSFGRFRAVDDVTFDVAEGEAVALWGSNGAGKTTVIRSILGLLSCRGTITIAGHDIRRQGKAARRATGYVPQELALYDDFRLPEALAFFARLQRAPKRRVDEVLQEVGLNEHRRKRIRQLSGGMKQRMALATALLADPPLLVLDELTSNLDAEAQQSFMSLLLRLKERGKTIFFTSHHWDELEKLADRVLLLEHGRLKGEHRPHRAESNGESRHMYVHVAEEMLTGALEVLRAEGMTAYRNGSGLHVQAPLGAKAAPIAALLRAQIPVTDFEWSSTEHDGARAGGESA